MLRSRLGLGAFTLAAPSRGSLARDQDARANPERRRHLGLELVKKLGRDAVPAGEFTNAEGIGIVGSCCGQSAADNSRARHLKSSACVAMREDQAKERVWEWVAVRKPRFLFGNKRGFLILNRESYF
jgi:hypothetical protein